MWLGSILFHFNGIKITSDLFTNSIIKLNKDMRNIVLTEIKVGRLILVAGDIF